MANIKKKSKNNLDFKKYLLLQRQFNILNNELSEDYSINDLFDELDWILCEHSGEEVKEIESLFKRLKNLLEISETNIIHESKQFLNTKKY